MVQKCNIRKFSVDDHYCNVFFEYANELVIRYSDHCSFISTDNKCKIKVGEPDLSAAVLACSKRVPVV